MSETAQEVDRLLHQAQLWLELLVPLSDIDTEATAIKVSAVGKDGKRHVSTVTLADTMAALQIHCGRALSDVAAQLTEPEGEPT